MYKDAETLSVQMLCCIPSTLACSGVGNQQKTEHTWEEGDSQRDMEEEVA